MSLEKRRVLVKSFFESQFEYCSLLWMCHSRTLNNRINRLHLRLIYRDELLSFSELLKKDGSVTIHHRNIQKFGIEMYKTKNNHSPIMMKEIFPDRNYNGPNIRSQTDRNYNGPNIRSQTDRNYNGPNIRSQTDRNYNGPNIRSQTDRNYNGPNIRSQTDRNYNGPNIRSQTDRNYNGPNIRSQTDRNYNGPNIRSQTDRNYNGPTTRSQTDFELPHVNKVKGQETLRFFGPKVWDIIPGCIKEASSLTIFKNKIKYWIPEGCPCRLCKDYIQGLGYVSIT